MSFPGRKWRACLRIARRDVWRSKRRSLLVLAMVGAPVMLVAAAAIVTHSGADGPEQALRDLGRADALVIAAGRTPVTQDSTGFYDAAEHPSQGTEGSPWTAREVAAETGGRVVPVRTGKTVLTTDGGAVAARVRELDIRDPVFEGLATLTSGRAPARPGEVLVSSSLAGRGLEPGTSVRAGDRTLRVVGTVRATVRLDAAEVVGLAGSVLGADDPATTEYLIDTGGAPIGWADVERLNQLGLVVRSRAILSERSDSPPEPLDIQPAASLFHAIVVGAVVLEVVLLAGPAFAVGARRQRQQLALLVIAGGTPRDVRRVVLAQGLVLGLVASAAGIALAIGALVVARPLLERATGFALGSYDLPLIQLVLIGALGTFSTFAAAFIPARQAARLQPVQALTGRVDVHTVLGRPIAGGLLTAGGVFGVVTGVTSPLGGEMRVVLGTFAIVGGLIMTLPAMLGILGRLSAGLPLPLRLAARDSARHQARSTAAVAAVMGTVIGVTALAIGSSSDFAERRQDYVPRERPGTLVAHPGSGLTPAQLEALTAEIRQLVPGRSVQVRYGVDELSAESQQLELLAPDCKTADCMAFAREWPGDVASSGGRMLVAEPADLKRLLGSLTAEQGETLRSGGVLVAHAAALTPSGTAWVRATRSPSDEPEPAQELAELPATAAPQLNLRRAAGVTTLAELVVSRRTAEGLGLSVVPTGIVVPPGGPEITAAQQAEVQELIHGLNPATDVYVERGFQDSYTFVFLFLATVGGLIVLVGTATSTALSLDDARSAFATLAALGADPRLRRAHAMAYAGVIGLTGAVLGVLAGAAPGIAITWPLTAEPPAGPVLDMPWLLLGLVVLAVPLFTALCAALFTRSSLPMIRRAT